MKRTRVTVGRTASSEDAICSAVRPALNFPTSEDYQGPFLAKHTEGRLEHILQQGANVVGP
ncbi:hypothetical protein BU23DRAFT_552368 [Bimuria novae-zelandiae CBS 107.79]|uniref:Uncharacterized protein n=1 Tax=Bimuria novae-zelandiae CBS 107.79 TaxID=1447943 RepID=A0A6A5VE84_9PLEO|nr:hypothetical protein BU23DRAFT_552368 [Bimuria novae-zelandiae CBS 107.79]